MGCAAFPSIVQLRHHSSLNTSIASRGTSEGMVDMDYSVMCLVFGILDPVDLVRSRLVCQSWYSLASNAEIRLSVFIKHWGLKAVCKLPKNMFQLETAALCSFVRQHRVQRTDTLQMLAVRHGTDVNTLKRTNNMISDHSMYSRHHLYIPVRSREELSGQYICFERCSSAGKDFIVAHSTPPRCEEQQAVEAPADDSKAAAERQAKLAALLGLGLHIDAEVARYYVQAAGTDLKAAIQLLEADKVWERTAQPLRRHASIKTELVQQWIDGEFGF